MGYFSCQQELRVLNATSFVMRHRSNPAIMQWQTHVSCSTSHMVCCMAICVCLLALWAALCWRWQSSHSMSSSKLDWKSCGWVGLGCGKHHRDITIHQIYKQLAPQKSFAFPLFYALTGCDTTPQMLGCGKKTTGLSMAELTLMYSKGCLWCWQCE